MKKLRRLRIAMVFTLLVFFIYCPLERAGYFPTLTGFPLYNWELGFGRINSVSQRIDVYLYSIDGRRFEKPRSLFKWASERDDWIITNDYKILLFLGRKVRHSNPDQVLKGRATFEERFFKKNGIKQSEYEVVEAEFDPLELYLNGKYLSKTSLGTYTYEDQ